ncbi:MAG: MBOAT family protein [Oscillospiraceae bacterium]|nr:MBOAT family protein [Oscillospiraceae bacterium]
MLFSSIPFLYYFFPIVLIAYFAVPKFLKNSVILLSSLVFYAWGEPRFVILMAITIAVGFAAGLLMEKAKTSALKRTAMIVSVAICLAFLGYFKYVDFFIENFNAVTGLSVKLLNVALPIGISFYTFQIISYIVDVYRGSVGAQHNVINFAAYVAMFPQLIAGPIVRYSDIARQLESRNHSIEQISYGIRRFVIGLGKKVLIANTLGELCDIFKASDDKTVLFYWVYAIAFSLHIYFDFSGYSDMAIGIGHIFAFKFIENFDHPFISSSITEFWRRWHMSLGSWFRDYVYIPLGGNRVSKLRWFFNIFVVWALTGFWHGAEWNFIIWGLMFGILLVIEKVVLLDKLKKTKVINHIYVMFFVLISFVIFNASSMSEAFSYIGGMFGAGGIKFASVECFYYLRSYGIMLIIGIIGSTPLIKNVCLKLEAGQKSSKIINVLEPVALAAILILCTAFLVDGSFNPFLYFRF